MLEVDFTGLVVTYNEAELLSDCLSSLSFCDELIAIDLGSSDDCAAIAKRFGARVLFHPRDPVVEKIRVHGFQHASNDWIIYLDPDERFHPRLVDKVIEAIISNPRAAIINVPWQFYFGRNKLTVTHWGRSGQTKGLIVNRRRVRNPRLVHSGCVPKDGFERVQIDRDDEVYVKHYWMRGYRNLFSKHWMYIVQEGKAQFRKGKRFSYVRALVAPAVGLKQDLLDYHGWKGGLMGIFLSFFWAWYIFMREMSLWLYERRAAKLYETD